MRLRKYCVKILIIILLLASACSRNSQELNRALALSGDNKPELEKVISHYSESPGDSLKLKAAIFLIENMPGHYSYHPDSIASFRSDYEAILDKQVGFMEKKQLLTELSERYPDPVIYKVEDVQIITADYLIKNIDLSFKLWETSPYARHLNFNQFCEYILPYKCEDYQELDNWKTVLFDKFTRIMDQVPQDDDISGNAYYASMAVNFDMSSRMGVNSVYDYTGYKLYNANTLSKIPFGTCEDYSLAATAVMRSKGIPVFLEEIPLWGVQRTTGHLWHSLLNSNGANMPFPWNLQSKPGDVLFPEKHIPKISRKTYSANPEILNYLKTSSFKSNKFDPFQKDVTSLYIATNNLVIPISDKRLKEKYAYIAIFNTKEWSIVDFGEIKNGNANFHDMGRGVMYIVLGYDGKRLIPVSSPFILEKNGMMRYCKTDISNFQTVRLIRKYPKNKNTASQEAYIIGGQIQASDDKMFNTCDTLYTIKDLSYPDLIRLDTTKHKYRYWRYIPSPKKPCAIAELQLFESGSDVVSRYDIISSVSDMDKKVDMLKAFDGDWLTSYTSPPSTWIGIDAGKAVYIDRVRCVPRSDDNGIHYGDSYELFYWGNDNWISLKTKIADSKILEYNNVPSGAVLLLRNNTRGADERIFTYENDKQRWW